MNTVANCLGTSCGNRSISQKERLILLSHLLKKSLPELQLSRTQIVEQTTYEQFMRLLKRREQGEPIAYILGTRAFWTLDLTVNTHTLIPRPETELLVETALERLGNEPARVADLGTGSGAIALAVAVERPAWQVYATDICAGALQVAKQNAKAYGVRLSFTQGNWFEALPACSFQMLCSNPPYIAKADPHLTLGDLPFEPCGALLGGEDGLEHLRHLVSGASAYLSAGGYLLLEHGFDQGQALRDLFGDAGYQQITTLRDYSGQDRLTLGQWTAHAQ